MIQTSKREPHALAFACVRNLLLGLLVAAALALGAFAPFDRVLSDKRFALATGPVSGRIATVEIDSKSLNQLGVWPWPRTLHAELIDRLMALGARRIVFDIDFSAASTREGDAAFAQALSRADGKVWLAVFEQNNGPNGASVIDAPISALSQHAHSVFIDVPVAPDGFVRDYNLARDVGGVRLPTLAGLLADRGAGEAGGFAIDYGLDLSQIVRLSAADVLAQQVPRLLVEGRDIVIGASAEQLRDLFLTPLGPQPGLIVHTLAAETLLMGRELRPVPTAAVVGFILLLALLAAFAERRLRSLGAGIAFVLTALFVEAGALALHKWAALTTASAGVEVALALFGLAGLVSAFAQRRGLLAEAARERSLARAMLSQVIADNFDGVIVVGDDRRILEASRPAGEILNRNLRGRGLDALPDVLAQAVLAALAAPGRPENVGEAQWPSWNGPRHLEYVVTVSQAPDAPERRAACLTFRDVTERRAHLARLDYIARHDEITGAFTRGEWLARTRKRRGENAGSLTVCCLWLRRFDLVNDVFGRRVGDCLLKAVVERLLELGCLDVARLGGASFAFSLVGADAEAIGPEIVGRIAERYWIDGQSVIVGASLGAAVSGDDAEVLLTHASMAQASAARRVGDVFAMFSPDMETRRREKQALDADLRQAVADGKLTMFFQAKVDLADLSVCGAEALVRWRKPDGSYVSPAAFVPVAEESGLIVDLGRFVLGFACHEAAHWPAPTTVAVNVSPVQFGLSDVFADVEAALAASGLEPSRLEIEITESAFAEGDGAISLALEKLRALGVKIALDDFGTGYSSLHYLGRLPIDTIKIDQSFVRAMESEPSAAATVRAIVALAKAHGKSLVAEGIETQSQALAIAAMGCEYGQGYFFGRPVDAQAFLPTISGARAAA